MNALVVPAPETPSSGRGPSRGALRSHRVLQPAARGDLADERARHREVTTIAQLLQRAGPYLLLELLLPGGTLFALLLFVYRNRPFAAPVDVPLRSPVVVSQVVAIARRPPAHSDGVAFAVA